MMLTIALAFVAVIVAYLIGSLSSAIITTKLLKLPDPRKSGSGNPGATNVLRTGGKKAAIITLIGDVLKGFIPVKLAFLLGLPAYATALVMIAAVLGHLYPVFFEFKGGKGVATSIGVLFAFNLPIALIAVIIWIIVFAIFRYSSLAALTAIIFTPIYAWSLVSLPHYIAILIICAFLLWRHRGNIKRLVAGTESQFKKS